MENWLNTREIHERTKIHVNTILRYLSEEFHAHHFNIKVGARKSKHIPESQVELIAKIKKWYDGGKTREEVNQLLEDSGAPVIITMKDDEGEMVSLNVAEELSEMKRVFAEEIQQLRAEVKAYSEVVVKQQEYIEGRLENRDRLLMESIRSIQEEKKALLEVAAEHQEKEQEKGFWSKLFRR